MTQPGPGHSGAGLEKLPSVDRVIQALPPVPHDLARAAARAAVDSARRAILEGQERRSFDRIVSHAGQLLAESARSRLQKVVNATGVLVHTNLGRAPLGPAQLRAIAAIAGGYSNLEYDLEAGTRGSRYTHACTILTRLTGAESALVVNNNAAAVLVVLAALCAGREAIISRGELIEIGGEFRIPEVMSAAGVRLVEVGTTNRTHLGDYERAIGPATAAVLKVHPSNYRIVGFTATVGTFDLARLAHGRGSILLYDAGSGLIADSDMVTEMNHEPSVSLELANGADIVTFSGDKLLGGPQAGIIVGRRSLIDRIARHPLLRAVRVDKMTLAALEATANAYLEGRASELPLWRLAAAPTGELEERARALAHNLETGLADAGIKTEVVMSKAVVGGGSVPGTELPSWAVAIVHAAQGPEEVAGALRRATPPVVARIEDDRLLLDLRSVQRSEDHVLEEAVVAALVDGSDATQRDP